MKKAHSLRTLVVLVSCLLLASGAFAAEMVGFGDGASWNLDKADFGGMLSIAGPAGVAVQKAFGPGEAPTFSIWDKAGYALPDGQYNWQISLNAAKRDRSDAPGAKAAGFSGTFRIESGSLVIPKAAGFGDQDSQNKDQQILDDLIVQGSACVGTDCSNGENFGFDTIRMKENNVRLKFDDTSNSASFPSNDWQLTANDSSNGGANKFSVDDITGGRTPFTLEAGAPTNAMYVSDAGDLGLGTATPVVDVHAVDGNTPTLRLQQDGSSGFTAQTWDVAGNEAGFFVRDVTNGGVLPFRITTGAPNDFFVIAGGSTDSVGIGAGTSPDAKLHVQASAGAATDVLKLENNGPSRFVLQNTTATGNDLWRFNHAGGGELRIGDSDADVEFQVSQSGVISTFSACIQLSTFACTASDGAFSCVSGNCP